MGGLRNFGAWVGLVVGVLVFELEFHVAAVP